MTAHLTAPIPTLTWPVAPVSAALAAAVSRALAKDPEITAQLIDGETDAQLWSEKYGGTMDDVFAMQERISRAIVEALSVQLSAQERDDLAAGPIADLEAYQLGRRQPANRRVPSLGFSPWASRCAESPARSSTSDGRPSSTRCPH